MGIKRFEIYQTYMLESGYCWGFYSPMNYVRKIDWRIMRSNAAENKMCLLYVDITVYRWY